MRGFRFQFLRHPDILSFVYQECKHDNASWHLTYALQTNNFGGAWYSCGTVHITIGDGGNNEGLSGLNYNSASNGADPLLHRESPSFIAVHLPGACDRSQQTTLHDLPVYCMARCGGRGDHDTDETAQIPLAQRESNPTTHQVLT